VQEQCYSIFLDCKKSDLNHTVIVALQNSAKRIFQKEHDMNTHSPQNGGTNCGALSEDIPLSSCVEAMPATGSVALSKEQHLRLRDAYGWTVKAESGTIWLTQESDSRDIVLKAGDSFVLDRQGAALISPLNDAKLSLKRESINLSDKARNALSKFLPAFSTARALFA
jgi:hypothetical protein